MIHLFSYFCVFLSHIQFFIPPEIYFAFWKEAGGYLCCFLNGKQNAHTLYWTNHFFHTHWKCHLSCGSLFYTRFHRDICLFLNTVFYTMDKALQAGRSCSLWVSGDRDRVKDRACLPTRTQGSCRAQSYEREGGQDERTSCKQRSPSSLHRHVHAQKYVHTHPNAWNTFIHAHVHTCACIHKHRFKPTYRHICLRDAQNTQQGFREIREKG